MAKISKFAFFIFTSLILGCDAKGILDINPETLILGKWEWKMTETPNNLGEIELFSPLSENYNEIFIFEEDSSFFIYRNDSLRSQGIYWSDSVFYFSQSRIPAHEELHLFLKEENQTLRMKVSFDNFYNYLILDSFHTQVSTVTFVRIPQD